MGVTPDVQKLPPCIVAVLCGWKVLWVNVRFLWLRAFSKSTMLCAFNVMLMCAGVAENFPWPSNTLPP